MQHQNYSWYLPCERVTSGYQSDFMQFQQPHQTMQPTQPCQSDGSWLNHHAFNGEITNNHPRTFYDLSRTASTLEPGQTIGHQRQSCENRQTLTNRNIQIENNSHKGYRNTSNCYNQNMNIFDFNRKETILNPEQTTDHQRLPCENRRPLISTNGNTQIENYNHKDNRNTNNSCKQTVALIGSNNGGTEHNLEEDRCIVTMTNKHVKQTSEKCVVQSDVSSAISRQTNNTMTGGHNDESFSVTTNTPKNNQGEAPTQDCCICENSPTEAASKDDRVLLQQWYAHTNSETNKDNENDSNCARSDNHIHLTEIGNKMDIWTLTGSRTNTSLDRPPEENKNTNMNENDSETIPTTTDQRRENDGLDGIGIKDVMPDVRDTNSKMENPTIARSERKRSCHSEQSKRGNLKRSRIDNKNSTSKDIDEHRIETNIQRSVTHDGDPDTGNGVFLQKRSHFYILFHQKKHLCLSKYRGKYILMREFLHNCFTEKQHKLVFQEKMKQKIPFIAISDESRNGALNYMMYKGLIRTKVANIGMIHVQHANRLYHIFHGEDRCGVCIKLYKDLNVTVQANTLETDVSSFQDASSTIAFKATEQVSNAVIVKNNENADVSARGSICGSSTEMDVVSPTVGKNFSFFVHKEPTSATEKKNSDTAQILKSPGTDDGYESAVSCVEETGIEVDETCATDSNVADDNITVAKDDAYSTSEARDEVFYNGGIIQLFDKLVRFIEVYDEKFLPMADIIKTFEETEIQKSIDSGNINVFKGTSLEAGFLTDFKQFEAVKAGDAIVNGRILLHVCRSPGVYLKQDSPTKVIQGEAG